MTDPRWQRLTELVPEAVALPLNERVAFLDRTCVVPNGDVDEELRAEAGALLAAAEAAELSGALASPLSGLASGGTADVINC